ncbi:hypothetical protein F4827_006588 [Paraburkholderia bannensis]|uniref:Uncharacterized protein n=1 Tax=Paraburkholderia bannensis TaxID=765414 RepID=A0A7W9U468_9BURK|nr:MULTISPECIES: hypothetical protein [Paraburkholderia]MBB3261666.1 hypothetical protein [Paraburkholderia sp. WP4_3_2]MBB6106712.1 hypothetical protein [Paraburkholderia bannensis]
MSTRYSRLIAPDREKFLDLLRREAQNRKKANPGQILSVYQNELAKSYSYSNWSMMHRHVSRMKQSQFDDFCSKVLANLRTNVANISLREQRPKVKCALFSPNIGYVAREFKDGDPQAIVLADATKIKAEMESNDVYYYNAGKVHMHKGYLKSGLFEIPLVAPRSEYLHWIEGFHQVNAAIELGMKVIPVGTSLALAQELKSLVGTANPTGSREQFDFSGCEATVM